MDPYGSTDELLEAVERNAKAESASKVTSVKAYRRRPDGTTLEITVSIEDRGESKSPRWAVVVEDENGRQASGNPHDNLDAALAVVHWAELDA